ncbi:MAG: type II toxin-antitoxin system VapC family toxin [Chloroflexota bacterium]
MAERVCLDASVAIKLIAPEEGQDRAWALLERIRDAGLEIVSPAFFAAEVLSNLRRKVALKKMKQDECDEAAVRFLALISEVRQLSEPKLYERAWELSGSLGMPTVYDAVYLAVAEAEAAEFWTADRKLYDQAQAWPEGQALVRLL